MRMAADNAIVVIHTRWAEDDLIGWLLTDHKHEDWTVVNLPGVAMDNDPIGRNPGEPLCPELHPLEQLELHAAERGGRPQRRAAALAGPAPRRGRYLGGIVNDIKS